ncbi:MAG: 2-isopropylmalate synthase [Candidatus Omnitrophica bacterium]|nr:2-isopropylmalate synthase [Candidatus Omnitrophota bacterium]
MQQTIMPFKRYQPYPWIGCEQRTWPDRVITVAPRWCSVDLRDGNQALSVPMNVNEKMRLFELLVLIGFKEIEVGFPAASQIEYDFVRKLIEERRIPDDVVIQVLTPARETLIRRTFAALQGAGRAIVHLYNSTSVVQREVVFGKDKPGITAIAEAGARVMKNLKETMRMPGICFQYSPESFTGTEPDFALDVCHAVMDVWQPGPEQKMIINLPATVEMSTPNVYADRIEWFIRKVRNRDSVIISVHTHNDRGTAVAAAELAVMAGAERVEGALFGNGERTGNMDIVNMALNLFSQGIDPRLDFTRIDAVRDVYTRCTRMEVHPRHPYAGELVYTAFSGSHQDAINKGMKAQGPDKNKTWDVPYLPVDPQDIGRDYESIIRINSQSGKGGIAYMLEHDWGIHIPAEMRPEFAKVIQVRTEQNGTELTSIEIHDLFVREYLAVKGRYQLKSCVIHSEDGPNRETTVSAVIVDNGRMSPFSGQGNGPVDAFVRGIQQHCGLAFEIEVYAEHALGHGADAEAVAYIGLSIERQAPVFGAGIDANISEASIKAVISALNKLGL